MLKNRNFPLLGKIIEEDCLSMHAVMMTQDPPLFYWNSQTVELIQAVQLWREQGVEVYFTIDAGPNVHLICEAKDELVVLNKVKQISGIQQIIVNQPARGARLIKKHLF